MYNVVMMVFSSSSSGCLTAVKVGRRFGDLSVRVISSMAAYGKKMERNENLFGWFVFVRKPGA